jgi:DNA-binding response OmpR family regulator
MMTPAGEPAGTLLPCEASPPRNILVVDDDPDIRRNNAVVLHRAGYDVDTAEDGAAAWEALGDNGYDLMITDNNMPHLTGMELLKKVYAARMILPFIMATGKLPEEEFVQYPWLQPAATLLKPYTVEELLGAVKTVLREADDAAAGSEVFPCLDLKAGIIPRTRELASVPVQSLTSPRRILVVDDDSDTRQLSVDVLAGSGYEVSAANDGAAGWDALQTRGYDLIVTDNKMPRMTGIEMIGRLRSAKMAVPVIMATRQLPVFEFASRPWLKPDAALERPFSNDDLLETVKKVLGQADRGPGEHSRVFDAHHL